MMTCGQYVSTLREIITWSTTKLNFFLRNQDFRHAISQGSGDSIKQWEPLRGQGKSRGAIINVSPVWWLFWRLICYDQIQAYNQVLRFGEEKRMLGGKICTICLKQIFWAQKVSGVQKNDGKQPPRLTTGLIKPIKPKLNLCISSNTTYR